MTEPTQPTKDVFGELHKLADLVCDRREAEPVVRWWVQHAISEAQATLPKALEYGDTELIDMGKVLGHLQGFELQDPPAMELAIWSYVQGKLGRWTSALRRGQRVSQDTLFDLAVYAKMAQKVRETGEWIGKR